MLHAACWKYRTQKLRQKSPSAHHRTTLSGNFIFASKACIDSRKRLLNGNISSICPHNMVNIGPLTAEICCRVWGTPANFNRFHVLAWLLHQRRSMEVNQTLHDVWLSSVLVYCIYVLEGSCPLTEFCQLQNSLCVQLLRSPVLALLLHGTRIVGISQSLRCGTRNGITELSQRAPPIVVRVAITLGIGRYSSLFFCLFLFVTQISRELLNGFA